MTQYQCLTNACLTTLVVHNGSRIMTRPDPTSSSSEPPLDGSVDEPTRVVEDKPSDSSEPSFSLGELAFKQIGRYKILSQLGGGGFGLVFRAFDPELNCDVAIKVPRPDRVLRPGELDRFRLEARTLARIRNHPSIVTVYDVGQTDDGIAFAVMEFVEGEPLSRILEGREPSIEEALQILLKIGAALTAAHQASIVHRDLKPSNVILDKNRNVILVDFGLALHDDLSMLEPANAVAGTPKYMAPEQIRGENHRIDGRTDIWGFGVIMYRMLTGKHPFRGEDPRDLARAIRYKDARPLRQLNPNISKEIERICLKCLAKSMSDRYLSVPDLLEDLTLAEKHLREPEPPAFVAPPRLLASGFRTNELASDAHDSQRSSGSVGSGPSAQTDTRSGQLRITYKGLRPFDSNDSEFFLALLPGPRTRDGIPESIQFWRSRILGDELEAMEVGLIYGPSGCGKSSFLRAGLLPVLPARIVPVYLECTSENTEHRLVQQIAHRIHSVDAKDSLPEILRQIRRGEHLDPEDKLLVVLDQFEQWLHGNSDFRPQELTEALRQCDGQRISCLLLIRDDFWMSTSEFMKALDIPIREGQNALALPLFDKRHARKVLIAYGHAFERLPDATEGQTKALSLQQQKFIREAVKSLAQDGKVICVHLSVFAQIAKDREWTASELHKLGGLKGVGVRFLDDLFPSRSNSKYRNDQDEIVKSIFRALLPGTSTVIKGTSRTREQLWQGLDGRFTRPAFDQVLDRLESELRLISKVDVESADEAPRADPRGGEDSYRLTHDFLVVPIRDWLDRKQKETHRGRTLHRLAELGDAWSSTKDPCYIPSFLEYLSFVAYASKDTKLQYRPLLHTARRRLTWRLGIIIPLTAIVFLVFLHLIQDGLNKSASKHVENYLVAASEAAPVYAKTLEYWGWRARPQLELELPSRNLVRRLRASGFLIQQFGPKPEYVKPFLSGLRQVPLSEFRNAATALGCIDKASIQQFIEWASEVSDERRRSAFALLLLQCENEELAMRLLDRRNGYTRSLFVQTFPDFAWNTDYALNTIQTHYDDDLKSGLCLSLANHWIRMKADGIDLDSDLMHTFEAVVNDTNSAHGLRSAGEFALRTLGQSPAGQSIEAKHVDGWKSIELAENEWVTFVRIEGGVFRPSSGMTDELIAQFRINKKTLLSPHEEKVETFYLASIPVTKSLFNVFVNQLSSDHELRKRNEFATTSNQDALLPATGIKWHHAVEFCNWLSRRHGLPEYYRQVDVSEAELERLKDVLPESMLLGKRWIIDDRERKGFRLPYLSEWQFGYRATTDTITPFTKSIKEPFWDMYTSFRKDVPSEQRFASVYAAMPNQIGLFDMVGNSSQWCNDAFEEVFYTRCGGHIRSDESDLFAGVFGYTIFVDSLKVESFRIAVDPGPDGFFPKVVVSND